MDDRRPSFFCKILWLDWIFSVYCGCCNLHELASATSPSILLSFVFGKSARMTAVHAVKCDELITTCFNRRNSFLSYLSDSLLGGKKPVLLLQTFQRFQIFLPICLKRRFREMISPHYFVTWKGCKASLYLGWIHFTRTITTMSNTTYHPACCVPNCLARFNIGHRRFSTTRRPNRRQQKVRMFPQLHERQTSVMSATFSQCCRYYKQDTFLKITQTISRCVRYTLR